MIDLIAAAAIFTCSFVYVHDGDTLRCKDGTRVRLQAIDAPELPGGCRRGRMCVQGDPIAAKEYLIRATLGKTLTCEKTGMSYNRVTAWCSVGGVDLSCSMVRSGHAVHLPQYDRQRRLCR